MKELSHLLGRVLVLEADDEIPKNDIESLKSGSVSIDDIIEKLNSIRSGKSFKDPEIRKKLDEYFMSLKMPEKVALFAFLKGIAQILTGEIEPKQAIEPEDPAASVTMKKADYKRKIKPTVVKASSSKVPSEDTSAPKTTPAPIKAKTS